MREIKKNIVLVGGYSGLITLPRKWLKKNNLDNGGKVILKIEDNSIIIKPIQNNDYLRKTLEELKKNPPTEEELLDESIEEEINDEIGEEEPIMKRLKSLKNIL